MSIEKVGFRPSDTDPLKMGAETVGRDPDDFPGFEPDNVPGNWPEDIRGIAKSGSRDPGDTGV